MAAEPVRIETVLELFNTVLVFPAIVTALDVRPASTHLIGHQIRSGGDADITVFDPNHIIDKATIADPLQYSEGVVFVLVNGIPHRT